MTFKNLLERIAIWIFRLSRRLNLTRLIGMGSSKGVFTDHFKGFEKVGAVQRIFGEKTSEVLSNLKVEFTWIGGYMWIDGTDGHLVINSRYLRNSDKVDIYLDLIHELVHIKQFMDGRELFDQRYEYVKRATEIEAYGYTVKEAKRIGLRDQEICEYLKTEWMTHKDLKRLAKTLELTC